VITRFLEVVEPGPYASIQDLGRPGLGSIGVSASGACDRSSLRLANRLVGNREGAAAIEATAGGLALRADRDLVVAVTGAPTPITINDRPQPQLAPIAMSAGAVLRLGTPRGGVRTYVAVRGGLAVASTLGSCATDVLSGLGPPPLEAGQRLPVGDPIDTWTPVDVAPTAEVAATGTLALRICLGPRHDRFSGQALERLAEGPYEVTTASNRVGLRLAGAALELRDKSELPSEGLVPGALQVPPSGLPTLLLADHPVTGGYPVIAVVIDADLDSAGQAPPGQRLRFKVVGAV
jgi:biotin-dependent carboxylase-like uncharacterized protein